jgi:chromosomal replication initiator protein
VYLSAEQFTTYFIQALNGSGLPSFRRRYRHVDLLIVEDIQFFAGKRATLTELQHTIDSVLREGKQLVLTADRSPADLVNLGPEMVNRLSGGLVVRVELPDLEARGEIIRRAARERGLMVPEDVVGLIAERMPGDVRQLNGALNRLQVTSHAWRKPISMEMAANALEDVFRSSVRVVRLEDIEKAVCNVFEVTPSNLRSSSKTRKVSHPRMLAMFLARKYTRAGLTEIGSYFGRRSHATVVSATKKVELWKTKGSSVRLTDHECPVEEALRQVERRMLG